MFLELSDIFVFPLEESDSSRGRNKEYVSVWAHISFWKDFLYCGFPGAEPGACVDSSIYLKLLKTQK
jgi:hypothetical protein